MTTVTITIEDANGLDSSLLFPSSFATNINNASYNNNAGLASLSFRPVVNGVVDGSTTYTMTFTGRNFRFGDFSIDLAGFVNSISMTRSVGDGPAVSLFSVSMALDGLWLENGGVYIESVASMTADSLMNRVAEYTSANFVVIGNSGADTLRGSFYDDVLEGRGGADRLIGGDGSDTASYRSSTVGVTVNLATGTASGGHATGDTFFSIENITGSELNDVLTGDNGDNFIDGLGGRDTIRGGGGHDFIFGRNGGGTFYGDAGNDRIDGGDEDDTIYGGTGHDDLRGGYGTNTIHGEAGNDQLLGATGNDRLYGGADSDVLHGFDGTDILDGGTGIDTMYHGTGAAKFYVDHADDICFDFGIGDGDQVFTSVSYALNFGSAIEVLRTTSQSGTGAINLTGNELAQTIHGNNGANRIDGLGGADKMYGYNGNDTYFVDDAGDLVVDGSGGGTADRVFASVTYRLPTAAQIERLSVTDAAGVGEIDLTGNGFAQRIDGNAGANRIEGGGGTDVLYGFGGSDVFIVDSLDDVVVEATGGGFDWVFARSSYVLPTSNAEIERLLTFSQGATTALNLTGNAYGQHIDGNNGVNRIAGRGGADTLEGNDGNDIFEFDSIAETGKGATRDQIMDFEDFGDNETIDLSGFAGTLTFVNDNAFSAVNQVRAIQQGADVLIQINTVGTSGADGEILLFATQLSTIDASDFIL